MEAINSLDKLKNLFDNDDVEDNEIKSYYRNHTKNIAITVAFLLGVQEQYIHVIEENTELCNELLNKINSNYHAIIIRSLNNIRSNLILSFKKTSRTIRVAASDYTPIYKMDIYKDDFALLKKYNISIFTARDDLNEYLENINKEIKNHIDDIRNLFPEWIEFKYIKSMFIMPNDIIKESKKYQSNQIYYPYKRYFNWENPHSAGNILSSDLKLLEIIYNDNGAYFNESNKVTDASDNVKYNINEFIKRGNKIQIHVDGENCDPYRLAAMFDSLQDSEIRKIEKIVVYYDESYSDRAWIMLKHFTFGVDVEIISINRIIETKSLVDHKLVAGISKAVYKDDIDSIILASSDSDFWSVIEDVSAKYLILAESNKFGNEFKSLLWKHDIFYCYLDKFKAPENDEFFEKVFKYELEKIISETFKIGNAKVMLKEALKQSHVQISDTERNRLYNEILSRLQLQLNKDGEYTVVIP